MTCGKRFIKKLNKHNDQNAVLLKVQDMESVTYNQLKKLEGVWFWIRELKLSLNANDEEKHIERVRRNISWAIDECDKLSIPFSIQNKVLCHYDIYDDIRDILKNNNIKYKTS